MNKRLITLPFFLAGIYGFLMLMYASGFPEEYARYLNMSMIIPGYFYSRWLRTVTADMEAMEQGMEDFKKFQEREKAMKEEKDIEDEELPEKIRRSILNAETFNFTWQYAGFSKAWQPAAIGIDREQDSAKLVTATIEGTLGRVRVLFFHPDGKVKELIQLVPGRDETIAMVHRLTHLSGLPGEEDPKIEFYPIEEEDDLEEAIEKCEKIEREFLQEMFNSEDSIYRKLLTDKDGEDAKI